MPSMYDREEVKPMSEELNTVGVRSLTTPEEVDEVLSKKEGTTLVVVNSVCGCAAGNCRPGVALALQAEKIPDELVTVFAGVDSEATERAREYMKAVQPSSPCIGFFKDGEMIGVLERRHIEGMTAVDIGNSLSKAFSEHCTRQGPSVPKEVFESNESVKRCGSTLTVISDN